MACSTWNNCKDGDMTGSTGGEGGGGLGAGSGSGSGSGAGKPRKLGRGIGSLIDLGPPVRVEVENKPNIQHVPQDTKQSAPVIPAADAGGGGGSGGGGGAI